MTGRTQSGATAGTMEHDHDPETEIIMEILNRINAELDEIAEKLEEIGKID